MRAQSDREEGQEPGRRWRSQVGASRRCEGHSQLERLCSIPHAIKPKCANFDPNFESNSKTAHFERKRWAPLFKPFPRGAHWWWSRPNWLSWRRETWLGPSKKCHLGRLWMEDKNCPRGSEKLMGTARADRGSGIFFRLLSSKIELRRLVPWIFVDGTSLWVVPAPADSPDWPHA